MPKPHYEDCVFLNVPFDTRYEALLRAIVFTVHDCGLIARCAKEIDDGGQVRMATICTLMAESQYGIHDISRTGLDRELRLPRFNMPLELGVFIGAQRFGTAKHKKKCCLILDRERDRYRLFCSDLSGQEIRAHHNRAEHAVRSVRDWLSGQLIHRSIQVPGGTRILDRYRRFCRQLPVLCRNLQLDPRELLYVEYINLVEAWLRANSWEQI
jgi:hypothetical protein